MARRQRQVIGPVFGSALSRRSYFRRRSFSFVFYHLSYSNFLFDGGLLERRSYADPWADNGSAPTPSLFWRGRQVSGTFFEPVLLRHLSFRRRSFSFAFSIFILVL